MPTACCGCQIRGVEDDGLLGVRCPACDWSWEGLVQRLVIHHKRGVGGDGRQVVDWQ
jgi:hypothetical protein